MTGSDDEEVMKKVVELQARKKTLEYKRDSPETSRAPGFSDLEGINFATG